MDADDANHSAAAAHLQARSDRDALVTHNYVLVESVALVQHRLGMDAAEALVRHVIPLVEVRWIDEAAHRVAVSSLLAARRRNVSLVDWVSFQLMREHALTHAFAFDDDFTAQGFTVIP